MNKKLFLLLTILPLSCQDISATRTAYCTQNDKDDKWKYDLTSLGQNRFEVADDKWTYHIALCGETNIELDKSTNMSGDAIIQTDKTENHVVGTQITRRTGGETWVILVLGKGQNYKNHCDKAPRKAQIMFICDPEADKGNPTLLDEANDDADFCFYMFEWPTSLVCPKNILNGSGKSLSVFKLLLIELVVIVLVYFVLGISYKRYVVGARGYEQIPNLAFWKNCKEGIVATFDKCRGGSTAGIGGVRSDDITPTRLNINGNDDDERLIM